MPYDVLKAYIHLDSLARFNTNWNLLQLSNAWVAQPELYRKTVASFYTALDYNPLLFQQYEYEVTLKRPLYKSDLGGLRRYLLEAFMWGASNQKEQEALIAAMFPDHVLRIKVLAIVDSIPIDSPANAQLGRYTYNVMAQVMDTIKGQSFHPCQEQGAQYEGSSIQPSALPCIYFQYRPGSYLPRLAGWHFKEDSAFSDNKKNFTMHVGQEAVVFLRFINQKFDSTHDAFELSVEPKASYNALPIIDGKVRDLNRVWSDDLMIDYADWKNRFLHIRNKILTGTY